MKTSKPSHIALLISFAIIAPAAFAAEIVAEKPTPTESAKTEKSVIVPGSLTNVVNDSVTFSTLRKALVASGLDVTLGNKGAFTLFAPTDEAFDKLPVGTLGKLMLPENKEMLRSILLYHVVAGNVMAADLKDGEVKTMNGEKVKIKIDGKDIHVDGSKVFSADVKANNGVMHSVGTVLVPASMKDFSGLDK